MGISEISFQGRQFSASDPILEVWLTLVVDALEQLPDAPEWLLPIRESWRLQATEEFGFGIELLLDQVITDAQRRAILYRAGQTALTQLESFGDPMPAARLNAVGSGRPGSAFPRDLPAALFLEPARAFLALLEESSE